MLSVLCISSKNDMINIKIGYRYSTKSSSTWISITTHWAFLIAVIRYLFLYIPFIGIYHHFFFFFLFMFQSTSSGWRYYQHWCHVSKSYEKQSLINFRIAGSNRKKTGLKTWTVSWKLAYFRTTKQLVFLFVFNAVFIPSKPRPDLEFRAGIRCTEINVVGLSEMSTQSCCVMFLRRCNCYWSTVVNAEPYSTGQLLLDICEMS